MKKLIFIFALFSSMFAVGQTHVFKKIAFTEGGELFKIGTTSSTITINNYTYSMVSSYWQGAGVQHIKPMPENSILVYPHAPLWNSNAPAMFDGPLYYRKSDHTIRTHQLLSVVIIGEETLGGETDVYINELTGAELNVSLDTIAKINSEFTIKNLGSNSVINVTSKENLDINNVKSISLAYGQWITVKPAVSRFITTGGSDIIASPPALEKWTRQVADDDENTWTIPFTLSSSAIVSYNGTPLRSSQWSGSGTTTLLIHLEIKKYDFLLILN